MKQPITLLLLAIILFTGCTSRPAIQPDNETLNNLQEIDEYITMKYNNTWVYPEGAYNYSAWKYQNLTLNLTQAMHKRTNITKYIFAYEGTYSKFYIDEFGYYHNGTINTTQAILLQHWKVIANNSSNITEYELWERHWGITE